MGVSQLIKNNLINNYNIKSDKVLTIYDLYDLEKIGILTNEKLRMNIRIFLKVRL